ncbi:ATP-binding protein [Streptomyces sp. NPDC088921]|uniref:ATP-binding protein n=1 Tax=unclassified Streptomyces TaxID=2593676 RepID=UPI0034446F47
MSRKPWDVAFTAVPEEVGALRRILRLQLGIWGLREVCDEAQLCVSELVSNVITHVGLGTPATLAVSMSGTYLRIEVRDPDKRALPTLLEAGSDAESGRGMALIDAIAARWGVLLCADGKVTWCELATVRTSSNGHVGGTCVARAEALLRYAVVEKPPGMGNPTKLSVLLAEKMLIDVIVDLFHWLRAHGCDADNVLDRAQTRFEAEMREARNLPPQGAQ